MNKPDLDTPDRIRDFVHAFYERLLRDPHLAPIFIDVAAIDLDRHLPLICSYWEKLLLGDKRYQRHTMNIHRLLDARRPLTEADFGRWLGHFNATLDASYAGPLAEQARRTAAQIASNMHVALERERGEDP